MQKPGGEAPPQFRPGPPTPTPSAPPAGPMPPGLGPRPRMMNMGRPYAPPAMHGQGPMMPLRSPFVSGGHQQQQQSPRFGPPHPTSSMLSSPTGNTVPPPFGQSMPSAAPPSPNMMSSSAPPPPPPGAMAMPLRPPRGPPPPGPQQPQFPPPPGAPNIPPPPNHHAPPSSTSVQGPRLIANTSASLPSEPLKPPDDEVVRNIEVLTHFVIKNGPNFENMARAKQAGDPKFSFLFGGEPGSDAAIGQEYYHWFKMKSQMEQKVGREGEAKAQQAVLPGSIDPNQVPEDSNVVSSNGPLPVSAVSDMEMDMDMEDDMIVPRLITDDGRNFQTTEKKEELQSLVNHQEAEHREALDCQVKSLVAAGRSQIEVSKLESQKEKGKCLDAAFDGPCVEDVSPVRHMPKDMQQTLTVDKLELKSCHDLKEGPPVASSAVLESEPTGAFHVVDEKLETVEFSDNISGETPGWDDMEAKKMKAVTPSDNRKSFNEGPHSQETKDRRVSTNNNIALEPDDVKSNIAFETDGLKPEDVKSDMGVHRKPEEEAMKVDKYGRVMRKGNSDSESDDVPYVAKMRRDPSWSRSPSPRYNRRRKRSNSRSPRRKSRWSRSHSRSPKRRRSRSRTPSHDFRRGGDPRYDRIGRGRGTPPACNDFAKGRCYRGATCRFLHEDVSGDNVSRWSGVGRVKGWTENKQDVAKSLGGRDGLFSGRLDKPKSSSPDRYFEGHDIRNFGEKKNKDFDGHDNRNFGERKNQDFDGHDSHNFAERKNQDFDGYDSHNHRERKNQEPYRYNDSSTAPCLNFSRGRCHRGASCKYFHSETAGDNSGKWYGAGKGRERVDNRQDSIKSFSGGDNIGAGDVEKPKNISPSRPRDEYYRHNFKEKRSQETDRNYGRSVPACIFFARGNCQRGSSCRFLHEDASGENDGVRGRERAKNRPDLIDGQDRRDVIKQKSQEADKHNDSFADTATKPQFSSSAGEKIQPRREELWPYSFVTADAPFQHDYTESIENPLLPREDLKSVSRENVGQSFFKEGSTVEPQTQKFVPDNPVEDSHQHSNSHSIGELHPTLSQSLPRDLPSQQHHGVTGYALLSGNAQGSGGSSLSQNDTLQGTSLANLNVESNNLLPPGCPTDSSTNYRQSGIAGCSTLYQDSSIATNSNIVPQPFFEHGKFVQEVKHSANISTDILTATTDKKSVSSFSSIEPVLQHVSSIGQEGILTRPPTMPPLHLQDKSGQSALTPHVLELNVVPAKSDSVPPPASEPGKNVQEVNYGAIISGNIVTDSTDQRPGCSKTSLESLSQNETRIEQEGVMLRPTTMPSLSQNISGQIASAPLNIFGEQKTSSFFQSDSALTLGLSAINQVLKDIPAGGELHNSLSDTIESSAAMDFLKKMPDDTNVQDTKEVLVEPDNSLLLGNATQVNKDNPDKGSSPYEPEKRKEASESSMMKTVSNEAVHTDVHTGINVLENGSPAREVRNWSPGAATAGAADTETEQAHAQDESRKSKEIRAMKQFRAVLAEFVKEVLKPTWREGHMSKEAFKTIVKKVVDKVAGSLQSHQVPKTQERIDQYLAASRPKLTKLIQGYVDKYVKA